MADKMTSGAGAKDQSSSRSANTASAPKPKSKYQFVKENWGNRPNFQFSYGLKMTPEDIEEGNLILEALMEMDREEMEDH
ncbi:hypothetical protein VTN77DRAFT_1151 [Rasamsonia byssochlamydoides]|uniref:uncharacterized protein n=1 Tax=Rasamsonia byssochlamydoides TaxID=89139 RepID=UPI00374201A8